MADGVPRDRERLRYVEDIGKRRDSYCYVVPALGLAASTHGR
jgi:hypothetical protein